MDSAFASRFLFTALPGLKFTVYMYIFCFSLVEQGLSLTHHGHIYRRSFSNICHLILSVYFCLHGQCTEFTMYRLPSILLVLDFRLLIVYTFTSFVLNYFISEYCKFSVIAYIYLYVTRFKLSVRLLVINLNQKQTISSAFGLISLNLISRLTGTIRFKMIYVHSVYLKWL